MKTGKITQTVVFDAEPSMVYELIMDAEKHAAIAGSEVHMSKMVNGHFEVYDGYCHGFNIELKAPEKIVQAWHFAEDGWPDDHFSICTFNFEKVGDGTKLLFTQEDIPEHKVEDLQKGWVEFYWEPMKAYLGGD